MPVKCPRCGSLRSHVVKTHKRADYVYRRRECKECGTTWATKERPARVLPDIERALDEETVHGLDSAE
jgi:transcriptional regulator NrdR family protein